MKESQGDCGAVFYRDRITRKVMLKYQLHLRAFPKKPITVHLTEPAAQDAFMKESLGCERPRVCSVKAILKLDNPTAI